MKKAIALLAVALVIPTSVAVAKSNPTRGKSNPMVMYVLKGTLSGYTAASATADGQVSITVNHSNYHGRGLKGTTLTFGTTTSGPDSWGVRLINQSSALGVPVDAFTIMPLISVTSPPFLADSPGQLADDSRANP